MCCLSTEGVGQAGTAKAVCCSEPFPHPKTALYCLVTISCHFGHLCASLGMCEVMRFRLLWNMTTGIPVTVIIMHL